MAKTSSVGLSVDVQNTREGLQIMELLIAFSGGIARAVDTMLRGWFGPDRAPGFFDLGAAPI